MFQIVRYGTASDVEREHALFANPASTGGIVLSHVLLTVRNGWCVLMATATEGVETAGMGPGVTPGAQTVALYVTRTPPGVPELTHRPYTMVGHTM